MELDQKNKIYLFHFTIFLFKSMDAIRFRRIKKNEVRENAYCKFPLKIDPPFSAEEFTTFP